ncbi:hypothetical protein HYW46_02790 [Candidatus Daviesbacteria bacterium]|nr:hypothetical protein [Candidatus Daviesbacteria bacterium]
MKEHVDRARRQYEGEMEKEKWLVFYSGIKEIEEVEELVSGLPDIELEVVAESPRR